MRHVRVGPVRETRKTSLSLPALSTPRSRSSYGASASQSLGNNAGTHPPYWRNVDGCDRRARGARECPALPRCGGRRRHARFERSSNGLLQIVDPWSREKSSTHGVEVGLEGLDGNAGTTRS